MRERLTRHRLLTLTGSGGCGKTRLAVETARALVDRYGDGVWLVEFAPLESENLLAQTVANALGLREQSGQQAHDTLIDHLKTLHLLIIFDNCEHLIHGCALLAAAILESCPGVCILSTSREPLGISGEAVWVVPPLSLPEKQPWRGPGSDKESLPAYQQSEAIQLFTNRAKQAVPDFELSLENAGWVATVCRRLDGVPLAIELAVARLRTLSTRQIAERLDDRFRLLTSSLRTASPRHKTLEAALDWSYLLLGDAEQKVLQRLSVFSGGWTLDAAEAVCGASPIRTEQVVDLLSGLVEKSMVDVVPGPPGTRRYRLLETIRLYARGKLDEAGETAFTRNLHLGYFSRWGMAVEQKMMGPDQVIWLDRIEYEIDNLRAAVDWILSTGELALEGLRVAEVCGHFLRLRGFLNEGRERLDAVLALPGARAPTIERARALLRAANLAYLQTDFQATRSLAEEGLSIARDLGPPGRHEAAWGLDTLGELATETGDYEIAPQYLSEALEIFRDLNNRRGIADMLMQLGWAAMRVGDYEKAGNLLGESLPLFRSLGEAHPIGLILSGLGELALRQGRYEEAEGLLEESLTVRRELGEQWGVAATLGSLGWAGLLQGDYDRMRGAMKGSIQIRTGLGEQGGVAWCLEKLAQARLAESQGLASQDRRTAHKQAVMIFTAAAALRARNNSMIDLADQPEYERMLESLRAHLGNASFEKARQAGESAPLEDIIQIALSPVRMAGVESHTSHARERFGGLSPRERQAALLIAQGKTNREIAEIMVVRVKTVETYVTRILNKLGFDSRVQVATWAIEVGLKK